MHTGDKRLQDIYFGDLQLYIVCEADPYCELGQRSTLG